MPILFMFLGYQNSNKFKLVLVHNIETWHSLGTFLGVDKTARLADMV